MLIEVSIKANEGRVARAGLYDPAKVNTDWPPLWLLITATALSFLSSCRGEVWHIPVSECFLLNRQGQQSVLIDGEQGLAQRWSHYFPNSNRETIAGVYYFHLVRRGRMWSGNSSWNISEVFQIAPVLLECLIITTFLRVISSRLIKHTHTFGRKRAAPIRSCNFFSHGFKWQRFRESPVYCEFFF